MLIREQCSWPYSAGPGLMVGLECAHEVDICDWQCDLLGFYYSAEYFLTQNCVFWSVSTFLGTQPRFGACSYMVLRIYICSHIVLCRYVLYGIVLVLDDFILCKCLQFGFMFVNSQLIQYGCTYMALYFVVLRHCIALGPVLPGTPGDWPTSHKLMYCFAVKPWSFIWLCISHTQSYWNAVLVFNVHLIYGQESGYQASSFENLTSLYYPRVPQSSTQFHTVPHSSTPG